MDSPLDVLKKLVRSIISELRSSSATWLEVLTNKGTQMLMLSVLELQSSVLDEALEETEALAQFWSFSSRTQIFSPLMSVIWLTT